jgi:hypothetical protein
MSSYISYLYDESVFTNFCSEVKFYDEISQEHHKSMTPKLNCVNQCFSCSVWWRSDMERPGENHRSKLHLRCD